MDIQTTYSLVENILLYYGSIKWHNNITKVNWAYDSCFTITHYGELRFTDTTINFIFNYRPNHFMFIQQYKIYSIYEIEQLKDSKYFNFNIKNLHLPNKLLLPSNYLISCTYNI